MPSKPYLLKAAAILVPILLGLAIRVIGIRHGEPDMVYHPDVAKQTLVARHVYHGSLDIRGAFKDDFQRTLYPYGTSVILGNASKLGGKKMDEVHRWVWALRMRYLSVALMLFSTLALLLAVSRRLQPTALFLLGTLILTEPVNSQFSHYGMNDVPLLSFILLTLAASLFMPSEKKVPYWSLLSGLLAGIGFAVKYQGLLALAFPGMAWLFMLRQRQPKASALSAVAVASGFIAGTLMLSPLLRDDPAYFFGTFPRFMDWQANIMEHETPMSIKLRTNLTALAKIIFSRGLFLAAAAGAFGCVKTWQRRKDISVAAPSCACIALAAVLLAAIVVSRDIVRHNDMIPVIPLILIPAVLSLDEAGKRARAAVLMLLLAASAIFTAASFADALALQRTDTRMLAREWCDDNLPENATVAIEWYTLPPTRADIQTKRSVFLGSRKSRHLVQDGEADICIVSSLAHDRFFDRGSPYFDPEVQSFYKDLDANHTLLRRFSDRPLLYAQPEITVYKLADAAGQ